MSEFLWSMVAKARELIDRLLAVRIVESSIVLAAQAFLAMFPLVIVAYAFLPSGAATGLLDQLRVRLGLGSATTDALQKLIGDRSDVQQSLSAVSILIVIGSATAFTRALQRVYQYAWDLPKLGLTAIWRGVVWLVGIIAYLGVVGSLSREIHRGGATAFLSVVLGFGVWWWTPYLLLGGRVCWRVLLPGAIITSTAQALVTLISALVMPRTISNNESNYGPIGVVFAVESWLVVVAGVLVAGAALGAAIGVDSGRLGTWARGSSDPDAWRREPVSWRERRRRKAATADSAGSPERSPE